MIFDGSMVLLKEHYVSDGCMNRVDFIRVPSLITFDFVVHHVFRTQITRVDLDTCIVDQNPEAALEWQYDIVIDDSSCHYFY